LRSMPIAYRSVYMVYLRSMRKHIWDIWRSNIWGVYVVLRSMRTHTWDIWRSNVWGVYVVYVWTWSKCEDGIRYIYLIL
jgi:hypothetical protein